jgi:hypothetical protein
VLDRNGMQHADTGDWCESTRRATVEPGPCAIGKLDVTSTIIDRCRPEPDGSREE